MSASRPEDVVFEFENGPVRILFGDRGGRYPDGNSILVRGERETLLIDPALGLYERPEKLPKIDRILLTHCHEDHIAGLALFPDTPVELHSLDRSGLDSLDDMMAIYGYGGGIEEVFREVVVERFRYRPRPDASSFEDGDVFDLGGVTVRILHTPGHTRGHSCMLIEWPDGGELRRLLCLGDIELSTFGPYYGDASSDLAEFERSLLEIREVEADWYATFHQIGVLEGREAFLARLEIFCAAIARRENALLEFLAEPHDIDEVAEHRFVYRPGDPVVFAEGVERRSMQQHIDRLVATGRLKALAAGRYVIA
jgi:glyoxylase-like metal-dependent hydrolase (beta-lactamase superfamily II)